MVLAVHDVTRQVLHNTKAHRSVRFSFIVSGFRITHQKGFFTAFLSSYSHIYYHINVVSLLSPFSPPFGVSAFCQHFQFSLCPPAVHDQPDGIAAHIWAKPLHIGNSKRADHVFKGIFHHFGFGTALRSLPLSPILEFAVSSSPDRKKVSEPRHNIMRFLMPTRGAGFQSFVVVLLGLLHDPFKADVSSDFVTVMVA